MTLPIISSVPALSDVLSAREPPDAQASPSSGGESGEAEPSARAAGRPKSHGCWMCHKSFDRPSTLRKVCMRQQTLTKDTV